MGCYCPDKYKCQFTAICLIFGLPIALIGMTVLAGDGHAHIRDYANAVEDECMYTGDYTTSVCTACDRYQGSGSKRYCVDYCTNAGIEAYYSIVSKNTCPDGLSGTSVNCHCGTDPYEPKNYDGEWHTCYIQDADICSLWSWRSYEEGEAMFYGGIAGGVVILMIWCICLFLCRKYKRRMNDGDGDGAGFGGGSGTASGTTPAYESNW